MVARVTGAVFPLAVTQVHVWLDPCVNDGEYPVGHWIVWLTVLGLLAGVVVCVVVPGALSEEVTLGPAAVVTCAEI